MPGISAVSPPISAQPDNSQPLAMPPDHCRSGVHVELAAGKIVQKEQGLGALYQHVVDAHGHQVDAHGVVHVPLEGQLELGAHAIGATDQHRFLVTLGHFKQSAKTANAGQHAFAHGFFGQRLDALYQCIAGINVNAGIFVGQGSRGAGLGHLGGGPEQRVRADRICPDFNGSPQPLLYAIDYRPKKFRRLEPDVVVAGIVVAVARPVLTPFVVASVLAYA
jgi:hypothetical protein